MKNHSDNYLWQMENIGASIKAILESQQLWTATGPDVSPASTISPIPPPPDSEPLTPASTSFIAVDEAKDLETESIVTPTSVPQSVPLFIPCVAPPTTATSAGSADLVCALRVRESTRQRC